jgi:hypothetical protein
MTWPTLRDKIAKGGQIEEDIASAVTGEVLSGAKVLQRWQHEMAPYDAAIGAARSPLEGE